MAKLLLIDDDDVLRGAFAEVLKDAGHQTIEAATGSAGIERARATKPDLVLCDVSMPGIDGYAVLEAIRGDSLLASTPFLFLTGLGGQPLARAAMNLGADDYLTKPVSNEELVGAVAARLARREASVREADERVEDLQRRVAFLLPHELRTPLTVILGTSEVLHEAARRLAPEDVADMAAAISKAAQRLRRMVENYLLYVDLELERQGQGKGPGLLRGVSGKEVVGRCAHEAAQPHGRAQDLDLEMADASIPLAPPLAGKVVYELIDNALKFSPAGTGVRVSLRVSEGNVALAVTDQGRGMTRADVDRVGAFRQFDRGVFEQQGSGLGLALVKGIVEGSNGRLGIVPAAGRGTTVQVSWPAT